MGEKSKIRKIWDWIEKWIILILDYVISGFVKIFRFFRAIILDVIVSLLLIGLIGYIFIQFGNNDVSFLLEMSQISFTLLGFTIIGLTMKNEERLRPYLINISKSSITAAVASLLFYLLYPIINASENQVLIWTMIIVLLVSIIYFWLTVRELYDLIYNSDSNK